MTTHVILDVSSNNGNVNFSALRQAHPELSGVIVKATEGFSYTNPYFHSQINAAKAAGLKVGAYEFVHPSAAGVADDQRFLSVVSGINLELGVWLDCEVSDNLDPTTTLDRFMEDAAFVSSHYPGKTGIYTGNWFWGPHTRGSVAAHVERYPLWVSGYQANFSNSLLPIPWTTATIWQNTDNWFGTGIDGSFWWAGDAAWNSWVGGSPTPPPVNNNRFAGYPTLRMGSQDNGRTGVFPDPGHPVATLQNAINIAEGWEGSNPNRLASDGDFGPSTNHGVVWFQNTHNLAGDGVVGPLTWATLDAALDAKHR